MKKKGINFIVSRWFTLVILTTIGCNLMILLIPSCKSSSERTKPVDQNKQKEELIKNQQNIVKNESENIDQYVKSRSLIMTTTNTGLRYNIYKSGTGNQFPSNDDWVKINYSVSLLDGSQVYSSDSSGALEFQVGKSDIASGLQEGVKLMKIGDKARFIVPSYLGYGLTGDGDQIKHYEALVIEAELLSITTQKR
ncbi:MAG: FKBP-type peptidyl-prolyl cis-trans isomerase [Bacteroidetes bacterium]|nr:FKBP-type peptidyl-prolyl cis-trans isomerase [Bacteroidota bacterium]